jgi:hypothetical protein
VALGCAQSKGNITKLNRKNVMQLEKVRKSRVWTGIMRDQMYEHYFLKNVKESESCPCFKNKEQWEPTTWFLKWSHVYYIFAPFMLRFLSCTSHMHYSFSTFILSRSLNSINTWPWSLMLKQETDITCRYFDCHRSDSWLLHVIIVIGRRRRPPIYETFSKVEESCFHKCPEQIILL